MTVESRVLEDSVCREREDDPLVRCFDMDLFSTPLEIRNRKKGDLFCPAGMGGEHQKVKEFMIDRKIPRRKRGDVPILVSPQGILWIIGWRADERFRVSRSSRKILEVRVTSTR
jgi:tRNA(Ile)-lysidine synthase